VTLAAAQPIDATIHEPPTPARVLWGLAPPQLHDRYWASRGIQVVRQGEPTELARGAELYLLTGPLTLTVFRPKAVVDRLIWTRADLMFVRVADHRARAYTEQARFTDDGAFRSFERIYGTSASTARVAMTPMEELARLWQAAPEGHEAWRQLRAAVRRADRWAMSAPGRVYRADEDAQVAQLLHELVQTWRRPDAAVDGLRRAGAGIWADGAAEIEGELFAAGPVWIGAGRRLAAGETIMAPAVIWDDPAADRAAQGVQWLRLEPSAPPEDLSPRRRPGVALAFKRAFDIVFSLCALAATLPLYPLILLAILIEDGRPFFFVHERETLGGRPFGCIKFRSMRKDAEQIKARLIEQNQADGPQFFIENDPRLTRVGRVLRKFQLDELPQFLNVLAGQMSVVGPRPSPRHENQYCPGWREARLSVRPGVTGLWQVKRTRAAGADFQEWIRYDLEYVERASLLLDLRIIWQTGAILLRSVMRS
jgi:lipopolysaccharide/colanic/teichoic acid biosynthesis glycosyltransferase